MKFSDLLKRHKPAEAEDLTNKVNPEVNIKHTKLNQSQLYGGNRKAIK